MGAYLHVKFGVCSIILTNFRQEGGVIPPPPPPPPPPPLQTPPPASKRTSKKPTQIRVKLLQIPTYN